jgi:hypothetical protein
LPFFGFFFELLAEPWPELALANPGPAASIKIATPAIKPIRAKGNPRLPIVKFMPPSLRISDLLGWTQLST